MADVAATPIVRVRKHWSRRLLNELLALLLGLLLLLAAGLVLLDTAPGHRWLADRIAGIGLRYYSSFGPIRIDVGTPLNPRSGDSRVAVAVSLGQAF